ncbi:ABC transporter substrate-binding protein [Nakamurella lactea]|uniref:ABC transporter substrate-binding protein n=1 Tax=Nakamurella lactea TaxID=459515 RepID=UPI0004217C27|nr:ABC transporter substrate-binding protein [Nakamurella lactea]
MKHGPRNVLVCAIAAAALTLAACSSSTDTASGTGADGGADAGAATSAGDATGAATSAGGESAGGGTIVWGATDALSGALATSAGAIQIGLNAYVKATNAAGGLDGNTISYEALDSAGDASRTATNITQLVTAKKATAIFGNTLSSTCSAGAPIVERYKVPMACLSIAEPNDWVYPMGPKNDKMAGAMLASAKQISGKDDPTVAIVYLNTLTVVALSDNITKQAEAAGVKVVASEKVEITANDLSPTVSKIAAAKPDVILYSGLSAALISLVKGADAAGLKAPVIVADGVIALDAVAAVPDAPMYFLSVYQLIDPANATGEAKTYLDAMTAAGAKVDYHNLNQGTTVAGYLAAAAFGEASTACGNPCSGADLKKQLDQVKPDFGGLAPGFSYANRADHYPYPKLYLNQVKTAESTTQVGEFDVDE